MNLKVFKLHCMCLRVCACVLSSGDNVVLSFHYGGSRNHSGFQVWAILPTFFFHFLHWNDWQIVIGAPGTDRFPNKLQDAPSYEVDIKPSSSGVPGVCPGCVCACPGRVQPAFQALFQLSWTHAWVTLIVSGLVFTLMSFCCNLMSPNPCSLWKTFLIHFSHVGGQSSRYLIQPYSLLTSFRSRMVSLGSALITLASPTLSRCLPVLMPSLDNREHSDCWQQPQLSYGMTP